jgi:sugar phosphate isomerase/epimerase
MSDANHDYAISTFLLADYGLDEMVRYIAEAGFRQIEISGPDGLWFEDTKRSRRLMRAHGIVARSVHTPPEAWDNGADDPETRERSLEMAVATFTHAAEVGAEIVICHANRPAVYTEENYGEHWNRSRESLASLAERAAQYDIKMAVENLPARGTVRPTRTVAEVRELIEGLGDHVGICLDAGHSNANGQDPAQEVHAAGECLLALHIQDNDGLGEDQHLLPGYGTVHWGHFVDVLHEVEFEGLRTFEVSQGDEPLALLHACATLARRWTEFESGW